MVTRFDETIRKISLQQGISAQLVHALVCQESNGNPYAVRFEPGYYKHKIVESQSIIFSNKHKGIPTAETEKVMRSTSFGLMQIMGQVAREHGYLPQFLTQLLIPEENLELGVSILKKWLKKLHGNEDHLILAWNRGPGCAAPVGDEPYLLSVKEFMQHTYSQS